MKQRILRPEHIPLMLLAALFCLSFFFVPGFNQSWLWSVTPRPVMSEFDKYGEMPVPKQTTFP